jgi:hypothetical protein
MQSSLGWKLPYKVRVLHFLKAPRNELSEFLAKRFSSYLARGQDVIAIRRITPNSSIGRTLKISP